MKTFTERINAKHPQANQIDITENECNTWARVFDGIFCYDYTVTAAGAIKLAFKRELGATEKARRSQPLDTVIMLVKGNYVGNYYNGHTGEGWLNLTADQSQAHLMSKGTAQDVISSLLTHAQYCYGGTFEAQTVAL